MGPDFSTKMPVKSLTSQQIVRIHQLFRQAKFDDPSGDVSCSLCLGFGPAMIGVNIIVLYCFLFFVVYFFYFSGTSRLNFLQCLSPAGEYNLRLGIIKELHPDMVATYSGRLCLIWKFFGST